MPVDPTTSQSDASPPERCPLHRPHHRSRQGPLVPERHPPWPVRQDVLPPGRRGRGGLAAHTALELAMLQPRDALERAAALAVARATWREVRADRLEAQVLGDLFAAGRLADPAEAAAAKAVAFKALGTLLRYRGRIEREQRQAMQALDALRLRPLRRKPALVPSEPEHAPAPRTSAAPTTPNHPSRKLHAERTRAVTPVEPPPAPRPAGDRAPAAQARRLGPAPRRQLRPSAGGCRGRPRGLPRLVSSHAQRRPQRGDRLGVVRLPEHGGARDQHRRARRDRQRRRLRGDPAVDLDADRAAGDHRAQAADLLERGRDEASGRRSRG